jgi:CheY-like chemotaxis protein
MNGTLAVESTPGRGSTFTVELPLGIRPDGSWPIEDAAPDAPATTRTVLCIDDNPANLMVIERLVAYRPEIRLLAALHGSLGVDLARTHRPDAILLDVGLPDASGHEILRRLRAEPSTNGIPVIVLSADPSEDVASSLLAAGARAHVTKPVDVRRLQHLLDDVLFGEGREESITTVAGATRAEGPGGDP